MRKILTVLFVLSTFLLFSCAEVSNKISKIIGSNPVNDRKGTYTYGMVTVRVSYDFISQMHQADPYFERELSPLADKIIYYYYYYLFSPQVLEALSNGDNKITGVPVSIEMNGKTISTKVNFEYPEKLVKILQYCKSIGGEIKVFIKDEYARANISNISYLRGYKDMFDVKTSTVATRLFLTTFWNKIHDTTLERFPHIACVSKRGYAEFIYAVLPMENLPNMDRIRYQERYMDKYASECVKKEKGHWTSKVGITAAEGILKLFGKDGCPVFPKYCIQRIDHYQEFYYLCDGAGEISGAGLKGIYDAVGVVDIEMLAKLQKASQEIDEEEKRKMIQNKPLNFWKCPKEGGLSPWVQDNSYCEAVK
ncbi:hypothetical protein GWK41_09935 [Persephonella atlantica]|uniref:Lipoprotein n=1 Tax=Persephonella atlantica TaxID=2699429 RepID=A0ABS1GKC8_9AQUI|nr:hypothetical protein [Persephonella atlantica]MBK3333383.1 hypothetical protein [Persephonella atlantica]